MIQKLLVVFVLFCLTTSIFAQDKITLQEERLSSFYPQSIFKGRAKGYIFKVGEGDFQPIGRKGENIEEQFFKISDIEMVSTTDQVKNSTSGYLSW